ncbi:unnamed protein product, partial [Symbiodinium sp. CCMP2592]
DASDCVSESLQLPCPTCGSDIPRTNHPMHLAYGSWSTADLETEVSSDKLSFSWSTDAGHPSNKAGYFIYGESFALGRRCHLRSLEYLEVPQHIFDIDRDSLEAFPVTSELLLHHQCENDQSLDKQLDVDKEAIESSQKTQTGIKAKIAALETKGKTEMASLKDQMAALTSNFSMSSDQNLHKYQTEIGSLKDQMAALARNHTTEMASLRDSVTALLDQEEEHKKRLEKHKAAEKLEDQWHRPELPDEVVLSLTLALAIGSSSPSAHSKVLSDFLVSLLTPGQFKDSEAGVTGKGGGLVQTQPAVETLKRKSSNGTRVNITAKQERRLRQPSYTSPSLDDPSALLLAASSRGYWYKGSPSQAPCNKTVLQVVLSSPIMLAPEDADRIKSSLPEEHKPSRQKPQDIQTASLKLLSIDAKYLARPKFSPQEKSARFPEFVSLLAGCLALTACWHVFWPEDGRAQQYAPHNYVLLLFVMAVGLPILCAAGLAYLPFNVLGQDGSYGFSAAVHADWSFSWQSFGKSTGGIVAMGFVSAGWCFALRCHGEVLMLSRASSGLAFLIYPALIALYRFLGQFGLIMWCWMSFEYYFPISSCVLKVGFYGTPMLVCLLLAPWFVLPAGAYFNQRANCIDGLDWEVHLAFVVVICAKSLAWKGCISTQRSGLACLSTFVFYVLAELDMYTDGMFIAIAASCGSWYAYVSLIIYAVGVIVLQVLLPMLWAASDSDSDAGRLAAMFSFFMFPLEILTGVMDPCECVGPSLGGFIGHNVGSKPLARPSDNMASRQLMLTAVMRCLGEDLPQCILQYLFTIHVKKNPLIMFSIGTSLASSLFAVGKACWKVYATEQNKHVKVSSEDNLGTE